MNIGKIYEKIALASPKFEVTLRKFYWSNYSLLKKIRPQRNIKPPENQKIDFDKIIDYLKNQGIKEGSLLIIHSSYGALKGSGLSPDEIIDRLLSLIGSSGTLAMPVIRHYPEEPPLDKILKYNMEEIVCTYDVRSTKITTGVLPICLMKRNNSITSRFPLNPLTAVGPLADEMMSENLKGKSPHDEYSAWKFCHDHNAIILGLGIDLAHYLTMIHVAEEAFPGWPIKDWFRKRKFIIREGDFTTEKIVFERKPKWGMLHLADKLYKKDFIKNSILIENKIENTTIGIIQSEKLISFLNSKKETGYPYIVKKSDLLS